MNPTASIGRITAQAPPPCTAWDVGCQAGHVAETGFLTLVGMIARGTGEFIVATTTWWTTTPSVNVLDPAVSAAQAVTRPLSLAILVGSVLTQALRMILSRKGEPLVQVLLGLMRYLLATALGLTVLQAALLAGDALARDLLRDAAEKLALLLRVTLMATPANLWMILVLSGIASILAVVQWLLMALRQAGLLVLAAMIPLAASGSLNKATRGWLDRLSGWLLAIVVYKPAAAFVYYIGFSYLAPRAGRPGDVGTMVTGVLVLGLAVVAMPVLVKFFSWSGTQLGGSTGGGSGLLAAAGAVTIARAGRGLPAERAAAMEATGPGTGSRIPSGAGAAAAGGPVGAAVAAAGAAAAAGHRAADRFAGPPSGGGPA